MDAPEWGSERRSGDQSFLRKMDQSLWTREKSLTRAVAPPSGKQERVPAGRQVKEKMEKFKNSATRGSMTSGAGLLLQKLRTPLM